MASRLLTTIAALSLCFSAVSVTKPAHRGCFDFRLASVARAGT